MVISRGQVKEQAAQNITGARRNELEKISARPGSNILGCHMELHFANENIGWVSCLNHLWRTSDGGRTWQEMPYKSSGGLDPKFDFLNLNTVWAYTLVDIQKSEDGGYTWRVLPSPVSDNDGGDIFRMQFLKDGRRGWATGSQYVPCSKQVRDRLGIHGLAPDLKRCIKGAIFYTEDGGETWQKQAIDSKVGSSIGSLYIAPDGRVWTFLSPNVFYLADGEWRKVDYTKGQCEHKTLLETVGLSKTASDWDAPIGIFFVDDTGWLTFSNGYLAKSTDGGNTWCDLFNLNSLTNTFRKFYFSDANNGWLLADNIYRTKDGGTTWERVETNIELEDMYFLDTNHGWAISKEGLYRIRQ
jgi:photosystem II stability/assembly factor-like uncharacterized protein